MIRPGTRALAAAMLTVSLGACKRDTTSGRAVAVQSPEQVAQSRDSTLVSQNAVLQAQKDSLFGATRSLLSAIASIDSATALAGVRARRDGEPIPSSYEAGVRQRTLEALHRLRTTRERLGAITARVAALNGRSAAMRAQLDSFRLTVAALQTQLAAQQVRADSLARQLALAQGRADSLAGRTRQLGATIDSMTTETHRVFVVAGTEDYLIRHGIVEQVGGTRFPFIVRVGSTLRPTNTHPDTTLFTPFDMMAVRTVPVDTTRRYEVVSAQDLSGADRRNARGRIFRGAIHIVDPPRFWRASPYLILVRQ